MLRCAATIFLVAVASVAGAQEMPITLSPTDTGTREVHTRQAVTFILAVGNDGPRSRALTLDPLLPEGWKSLTQEGQFDLGPAGVDLHVVSFLVPSRASAGRYILHYRAQDVQNPSIAAECSLTVVVLPEISVDLKILESPSFVIAGSEYTATLALLNTGNTEVPADIEILSGSSFPFEVRGLDRKNRTTVPAGGVQEFSVSVRTDERIGKSIRDSLQITARLSRTEESTSGGLEAPSGQILARSTCTVEVVPLSVDDRVLTHTIPVVSGTTVSGGYDQGFEASLQEELSARGTVDEAGEHTIEFDLRKQLAVGLDPLFDPSDRYSIVYRSRFGEAGLGDLSYTVSPLLAQDEFGRGIQGTVNIFPLRLSALYFKDVWTGQGTQGLGGTVQFLVPRSGDWSDALYSLGLNVASPLTDRLGLGIFQEYSPLNGVKLQLDTAVQIESSGALKPAIFAMSEGRVNAFSWTAHYLRADPSFQGAINDAQSLLALAGVRFFDDRLIVRGGFSLSENNLLLNPALSTADRTMEFSLGAGGEVPGLGTKLSLDWENWRRLDRFPAPSYATWNNIVKISLRQPLAPFTVNLGSMVDSGLSDTDEVSTLQQQHVLSLEYQPTDALQFGLSLRYTGQLDSYGHAQHLVGGDWSVRFSQGKTQVGGQISNSYIFTQVGFLELLAGLGARLSHTFPWGHTLTAQGDYRISYEPDVLTSSYTLGITYGVPFDLPVSRKPNTAVVTGRVFNAATGVSMPGVILRLNGLAAVTDARGAFTFYLPQAGTKYIRVDMGTVEPDMVPVGPMPLEVTAPSGSKVSVEIGMIEGCTVTGNVGVFGFPERTGAFMLSDQGQPSAESVESSRVRLGGLGNVVVELAGTSETRRKVTSANGDFDFRDVRPGKLTLRIVGGQIPSYHTIEPQSFDLELSPGEGRSVEFRVVQEQRRIQIMESGASIVLETMPRVQGGETITVGGEPAVQAPAAEIAAVPEATPAPEPAEEVVPPATSPEIIVPAPPAAMPAETEPESAAPEATPAPEPVSAPPEPAPVAAQPTLPASEAPQAQGAARETLPSQVLPRRGTLSPDSPPVAALLIAPARTRGTAATPSPTTPSAAAAVSRTSIPSAPSPIAIPEPVPARSPFILLMLTRPPGKVSYGPMPIWKPAQGTIPEPMPTPAPR